MQISSNHIIRKHALNVKHYGRANAFMLQASAEQFCKHFLLPKIEALLDEYDDVAEAIQVDKLQIHVSGKSITELNSSLADKIIIELKRTLSEKIGALPSEESPNYLEDNPLAPLFFYLQNGYFKQGNVANAFGLREMIASWLHQKETREQLLKALQFRPAVERLANLVNEDQWWQLLKQLTHADTALIQSLKDDLSLLKSLLEQHLYGNLFFSFKTSFLEAFSLNGSGDQLLQHAQNLLMRETIFFNEETRDVFLLGLKSDFFKAVIVGNADEKPAALEIAKDEFIEPYDVHNIYVTNAGLVLVATYLPRFFTNINLDWNEENKDEARALLLLHYLSTGTVQAEEWQLVLPKLFMGIPLNQFINTEDYELTEEDKLKADELLEAVIANWQILKSTTVDGLRQTFLQRTGILSFREDKWHLFIEPESFDLLLDHLPWQISMIKLPWMKHLLQVQWR